VKHYWRHLAQFWYCAWDGLPAKLASWGEREPGWHVPGKVCPTGRAYILELEVSSNVDHDDLHTLERQLLYGSPATRRQIGEDLVGEGGAARRALLVSTVLSRGSVALRGRCLEVLGLAIACADRRTAEAILDALLGQPQTPRV
jgi:hypothetical protein